MGTKCKMVVLDLDGTLLTDDKKITEPAMEAVAACRERGIRVIIASARPPRSTRFASEILGLDEPMINYNGALIQNPCTGEIILHRPIPMAVALRLLDQIDAIGGTLVPSVEIMDRWYTTRIIEELLYGIETARAGFRPVGVGPLRRFINEDVTKIFTLGSGGDLALVDDLIQREYKDELITTRSDNLMLQVMDRGAGKVAAVEFLARGCGITMDQVAAVGDNLNDLELLRAVGFGVAMANAPETVRISADVVTRSNQEDGVAWALNKWILNE